MSSLTMLLLLTSMPGAPSHATAGAPTQQDTVTVKEAKPGLKAKAKVNSETAMQSALAKVPGGRIREAELEKEKGRLVYSFDITTPKKRGVDEVLVDATSGKVISTTHESAAAEAKEHAAEAKEGTSKRGMMKHDTTMMKHDSAR